VIYIKKSSLTETLIILFTSIALTFSIYKTNNRILFHDFPYPVKPDRMTYEFSFVWRDVSNFGQQDMTGIALMPFYSFIFMLDTIFAQDVLVQGIFLFTMFFVSELSMLLLSKHVGLSSAYSLFASLLYVINPYALFYVWRILNSNIFLYAFFPLIFKETLQIFQSSELGNKKCSVHCLHLLVFILLAFPAFTNPAWLAAVFLFESLFILIAFFRRIIKARQRELKKLLLTSVSLVLVLIASFWWYMSGYIMFSVPNDLMMYQGYQEVYRFNTRNVGILQLFSITGMPPLYENVQWYPFQQIYTNPLYVVFVGMIFSLFFVYGLLKDKSNFQKLLPFYLIPLFLYPIISNLGHIVEQVGWIALFFRDPYHKLGFIVSTCFIVVLTVNLKRFFTKSHRDLSRVSLVILLLALSLLWIYPFYIDPLPQPLYNVGGTTVVYSSPRTSVVDVYSPVINYLLQDMDVYEYRVRVLVFPLEGVLWYEPGLFWGNDILRFSGICTVSTLSNVYSRDALELMQSLENSDLANSTYFSDILSKFSIKYVLVRKKAVEYRNPMADILNVLSSNNGLIEVLDSEWFTLYRVNATSFGKFLTISGKNYSSIGNQTFRLNFTATEMSAPRDLNWTLMVQSDMLELYPLQNAGNYTWIDISPQIEAPWNFNEIIVVFQGEPDVNMSLSIQFSDGVRLDRLFPSITVENNGSYRASFSFPPLFLGHVDSIRKIFLSFEMDNPHSKIIKEISFKEEQSSIVNLLKYDSLSYTKNNPTEYKLHLNTTSDSILAFSETYDPLWVCYVNGERVSSFPLYGVINGFWINQTGNLDISIEYGPQRWFFYGSIISITTFFVCTAYLAYSYTKTKHLLQKLKHKFQHKKPRG